MLLTAAPRLQGAGALITNSTKRIHKGQCLPFNQERKGPDDHPPQPSFLQPGQVYPAMVNKALNRENGRPDSLEGKGASYNANLPLGKSTLHSHGNYFV